MLDRRAALSERYYFVKVIYLVNINLARFFNCSDDGIVIPQRYSNFLEPVMCEEAWKLVRKNSNSSPENWEEAYNTMYIAYLKGIFSISDPQELIIYKHPGTWHFYS